MGTRTISIERTSRARPFGTGSVRILVGFGFVLLAATGLLMLPAASSGDGTATGLQALFTTISAICVTGLVVVDTQTQWSFLGEAVILVVIQVGGLGYMAGIGIVLWMLGRNLGLRDRHLMRLYYGAPSMREAASFLRTIVIYTATFEILGALALFAGFTAAGVPAGRSVWWAVFHSVSAFNVAGFNITGADLVPFGDDPAVLVTVAVLALAGSLGAVPVILAVLRFDPRRMSLDAKLILTATALLLVGVTLFIGIDEWRNAGTLGAEVPGNRPLLAFFQAASWTSGFSAVDSALLHDETKLLESVLMLIGGAAGSTAGGIKIATFAVLTLAAVSTMRGRDRVVVFGRRLPQAVIRQAATIASLFVALLFVETILLLRATDEPFIDVLYEAASALGTVGWSTGITRQLGDTAVVILMVTMLLGRFLPLLLVLQMVRQRRAPTRIEPGDGIRLG